MRRLGERFLMWFAPLWVAVPLWGQKIPPEKPKLIVGITVSGMRYDYLSVYWNAFGEGGFKKMATNGANCKNARYSYLITDPSVGFASIATGARPSEHGVVSDYWYRRNDQRSCGKPGRSGTKCCGRLLRKRSLFAQGPSQPDPVRRNAGEQPLSIRGPSGFPWIPRRL
jgi:hypothetical protein